MSNSENKAKTLVIGDMHLKEDLILSRVDQAIKKLDVNRVVFCGDYVDEWHSNRSIMLDAIDDFLTWIDGKRKHGLDVDFVLGNHDMQYLRGIPGPGTHTDLYKEVSEALTYMKIQMACVVGNYVVTHAGITREWAYRFLTSDQRETPRTLSDALNEMFRRGDDKALAALDSAGPGRGGSEIASPLWADLSELYQDPLPGVNQIVGHTPVESIDIWEIPTKDGARTKSKLIFCDTFSLTPHLIAAGDGSMLLVEGTSARVVTSEELGLESWDMASWNWMNTYVLPFL